uniref:Uncharacterized protein n=1 Tax=Solanum lycopersicum TaxID=4081 RepID=A0A3Q7IMJ6_SOLLC
MIAPTTGIGRASRDGKAEMKSTKSFRFLCEVPSICIAATMFCFMSTTLFFTSLPSSLNMSFLIVFSMTVLSIASNSNPALDEAPVTDPAAENLKLQDGVIAFIPSKGKYFSGRCKMVIIECKYAALTTIAPDTRAQAPSSAAFQDSLIHLLDVSNAPTTGVGGGSRDGKAEMKSTKSFRFLCEAPSICIPATIFCFMSTTLFFRSLPSSLNMSFLTVFSMTVLSITSNSNPTLYMWLRYLAVTGWSARNGLHIIGTSSHILSSKSLENKGYFQAAALVLNAPGMEVDSLIYLLDVSNAPTTGVGGGSRDGKAEMKSTKSFRFFCEVPSICIPATIFCFMSTTLFFTSLPSSLNMSFLIVFSMTVLSIASNSNPTLRNNIGYSMSCIVFQIVATDDPILLIALKKSSTGSATVLLTAGIGTSLNLKG